jgi:hypothetical protein
MRAVVASLALVAVLFAPAFAAAETSDACVSATVEGQKLQRAGKLVAARERFATCARAECPADIVSRCAGWAQSVADAIPSLVVIPRDDSGKDVTGAKVTIDGAAVDATGRAIDLDPGPHRIVVEHPGAAPVTVDVVLHEAEKNRSVPATFPGPKPASPPPAATKPVGPAERPVPLAAWIAGGVAVAGYGVLAVFGIDGAHDRSVSHCDSPGCPADDKSRVDRKLLVADVGLAVGTVALGVAAWLFLTRPTIHRGTVQGIAPFAVHF